MLETRIGTHLVHRNNHQRYKIKIIMDRTNVRLGKRLGATKANISPVLQVAAPSINQFPLHSIQRGRVGDPAGVINNCPPHFKCLTPTTTK